MLARRVSPGAARAPVAVTIELDLHKMSHDFQKDVLLRRGDVFDLIDRTGDATILPEAYASEAFVFSDGKCDSSQIVSYGDVFRGVGRNYSFWKKIRGASRLRLGKGSSERDNEAAMVPTTYRFTKPPSGEAVSEFCFLVVVPAASSRGIAASQIGLANNTHDQVLVDSHNAQSGDINNETASFSYGTPRNATTEQDGETKGRRHASGTEKEAPPRRLHPDFGVDEDPDENESEDTVFAIINDEEREYLLRRLGAVDTEDADIVDRSYVVTVVFRLPVQDVGGPPE
ncbi:hypothetical protein BESB_083440 [Besnoitia besnoiti]|uniref:Uncharacterized protein n=1 Tax=Besnoitia besnoiti TaxID=94643 RepID=A0A2A9M5A2_BESBE|nr:hypothetical protein BESB_083440 [Besnoitia besnoiti]PFH33145.1 hypothetical protein BESB_083440 [Besnoitia besnoiti]